MERETLSTLLLILFGGLAVQPLAAFSFPHAQKSMASACERRAWLRLWLPVIPVLMIGAWLCGWALREPDPVRLHIGRGPIFMACAPFVVITLRAALRAAWTLLRKSGDLPICTVGLLRPRIIFSPSLAKSMGRNLVCAAWEHELAHARHRDPLRIWLAQIAIDLQWPWPSARGRYATWLEALEWARDDEARSRGVSGTDLASAVVAVARYTSSTRGAHAENRHTCSGAALLGAGAQTLRTRVSRLLLPPPDTFAAPPQTHYEGIATVAILVGLALMAGTLGAIDGRAILDPFLAWTWAI